MGNGVMGYGFPYSENVKNVKKCQKCPKTKKMSKRRSYTASAHLIVIETENTRTELKAAEAEEMIRVWKR